MTSTCTAIAQHTGDCWIGWIEEVPGVNAQESTKEAFIVSLEEMLVEALDFYRQEPRQAAQNDYTEELVVV